VKGTAAAAIPPAEILEALHSRGLEGVLEPARRAGALPELIRDLQAVDWAMLDRQLAALGAATGAPVGELTPPELLPPSSERDRPETRAAAEAGWQALRARRVALATVAGGQASRLGFDGPKGAYPLGPVSGASLFQILAGMVRRLRERTGAPLPWIIQTGPGNDRETREFFARRDHFGLGHESVRFVCQGTLPAISPEGRFLLADPGHLFRNPDGHGGFYRALQGSGLLEQLQGGGVDTIFYCQVDNPLAPMGDPVFLGHHLLAGARMSVKVVEKQEPGEKVGLVVLRDGVHTCIEYSDLPEELAAERAEDGGLRFRAGNIAMHVFALDFVAEMAAADLPLHLARKKVRALPEDGGLEARPRDGVKFETFVFDALPWAGRSVVQLAVREEEFAPVKNRSGQDSIATSRAALEARNRRWCAAALPGLEPAAEGALEMEPGLALDPLDLAARREEVELRCGGHLLARRRSIPVAGA